MLIVNLTFACTEHVCIQAVASIDHVPFSIFDYNADERFSLTKQDELFSNQYVEYFSKVANKKWSFFPIRIL